MSPNKVILALVIPYFKLEFFEETLKSLSNQSDKRFNVYIGDDASSESPKSLIEKYNDKFSLTYKRFENNLGSVSLTNQWARCIFMTGDEEWLMILGDDDILGCNLIEEFYNNISDIKEISSSVIRFASQVVNETGEEISDIFTHPKREQALDSLVRKLRNETRSSLSEYIFSRKSFESVGFMNYPLAWHSDDYAWLSFCENTCIYTINSSLVHVRMSTLNISGSSLYENQKNAARFRFYKDIYKRQLYKINKKEDKFLILRMFEKSLYKDANINFYSFICLLISYYKLDRKKQILKSIKSFVKNRLLWIY
jgi:glycosyltransferase involved in cell wall biosynthesis